MGSSQAGKDVDRDIHELLEAIKNADIKGVARVMKRYGYTGLHFAVIECRTNKIRRLLEQGADPNAENDVKMTPLHEAAEYCPEAIPILIKYGADPHARDEGGLTPLHIAALSGSAEATKALMPHADVNIRDNKGMTPLHLALEYEHCDVAMLLLQHGADIKAVDGDGRTPLHLAAQAGCVEVAKLLLRYGADISAKDGKGNTVIHYAAKSINKEIVELVLRGADVNAKNVYGETPLKILIRECAKWDVERKRCYEVAKLLVAHGANPNIRDSRGTSPLDSAKLMGYSELVELFRSVPP
ncbi:MAG: ankyrin repeat domain-containing protein [Pyrobaculum sp.]|jgi:cytohesin